jgi:hypothetical protein
MVKRYLVLLLLAMLALAGCDGGVPGPTAVPFQRHTGQDVLNALASAGLSVDQSQRDMTVGRDAPATFSDRYIFEIASVAPNGGQVLVFSDAASMQTWVDYLDRLRNNTDTRRDVIYTYVHNNVILQINTNLMPDEANQYKEALEGMP